MKSPAINNRRTSEIVLSVVFGLATVLFAARAGNTQQLQKGISVQMAQTTSAAPMPDADNNDAWIVSITADGTLYFGIDPMTPTELADKMTRTPRRRDQNFYVKADARAPFAAVQTVLTTAHEMGFAAPVLLTSQSESQSPGVMVSPKGLEVEIEPHSNAASIVVQVNAGQPSTLQVNDQETPAAALPDALKQLLKNRGETPVLVKTHGPVSFAPVAQVIDTIHSLGAKVLISTPEL